MPSVTQLVKTTKQPRGGFVPLDNFTANIYPDNLKVVGEYNISPALVGLAVDYGVRIALGDAPEDAFSVALVGAKLIGEEDVAQKLISQINVTALQAAQPNEDTVIALCKLSGYDSVTRAGTQAYKPVSTIEPNAQTVTDVANLIIRTKAFFEEVGPVVSTGFTFEGGLTDSAEESDGDYITHDTLWDLKVRKADPDKDQTLQILLYYLMGMRSNQEQFKGVTKIGIYNPWLQKSWVVAVKDLDEEMVASIMKDVLGYESRHARKFSQEEGKRRTVYEVIDWIRDTSETEKEKGTKFERASRYYLKNDPVYAQRFSDVWMWNDAPTNDGVDVGIDLVAQDAEDGSYWAIQCKCYQSSVLNLKDVATFYTKAGIGDIYKHNMIISTCEDFGPHLDKTATEYGTVRLFADSMAESDIDWDSFIEGKSVGKREFKEPRPHQRQAIDACLEKFQEYNRGQLIMACGTGKTITSLRLTEELLPEGSLVLFLAPSIALVSQTMREWANQSKRGMRCAVVCSDETASRAEGDTWETSLADLPYPATTDPQSLYEQVKRFDRTSGINVVF